MLVPMSCLDYLICPMLIYGQVLFNPRLIPIGHIPAASSFISLTLHHVWQGMCTPLYTPIPNWNIVVGWEAQRPCMWATKNYLYSTRTGGKLHNNENPTKAWHCHPKTTNYQLSLIRHTVPQKGEELWQHSKLSTHKNHAMNPGISYSICGCISSSLMN